VADPTPVIEPVIEPVPEPSTDPVPPVDQPSDETVAPVSEPSLPAEGPPDVSPELPAETADEPASSASGPDNEAVTKPVESSTSSSAQHGDEHTKTDELPPQALNGESPTPKEFVALLDDDEAIALIRAGVAPEAVLGVLAIPAAPVPKTSAPGKPAATHAAVGSTLASGDSGQSPHGGSGATSAALFGDRPNAPPAFQALQLSTANLIRFSIAYPPLIPPA
jgi:hypothetical protein